jgi:hypothetical protein
MCVVLQLHDRLSILNVSHLDSPPCYLQRAGGVAHCCSAACTAGIQRQLKEFAKLFEAACVLR